MRDALTAAADGLAAAGVDTPRLDAELLLAEGVGVDRTRLVAEPEARLAAGPAREFASMVRRRLGREPVAYILGRRGFRRLELAVDARALIPRPETELLVDLAVALAPNLKGSDRFRVLDVGTGCGAVALAIADEVPRAAVVGTDTSLAALGLAGENADRLGLTGRVAFEQGTLPPAGVFDLLVANLPYVSEAEWSILAPEITRFEPRSALVAGPTGLEAIEELLGDLSLGGCEARAVALEVGAGQAPSVAELVRRAGFDRVETRRDLGGLERAVVGRTGAASEVG